MTNQIDVATLRDRLKEIPDDAILFVYFGKEGWLQAEWKKGGRATIFTFPYYVGGGEAG